MEAIEGDPLSDAEPAVETLPSSEDEATSDQSDAVSKQQLQGGIAQERGEVQEEGLSVFSESLLKENVKKGQSAREQLSKALCRRSAPID